MRNLRKNRLLLYLLFLLFPVSGTWAQNDDWQVQEGLLRQNAALYSSMVQDSFGIIWIGGEDGLRYYDGNTLSEKLLEGKNIRLALSHNKVLFAFDDSGSIWMQNRNYAFRLEKFAIPANFVGHYPLGVELLHNGTFCLLDKYAGILIWNEKEQLTWALPNAEYSGLCYTNSVLWVSSDEGLWYCSDYRSKPEFKRVSGEAAPADHIITAIEKQRLDGVWATTYSGEILAYQIRNAIPSKTHTFIIPGIPKKISHSEHGLFIEISEGGIVKLDHNKGRNHQVYTGAMLGSLIDREGNLFIAKRDGSLLKKWIPLKKLNFKTSEIRSIIQSKTLGTVVAAETGVWYLMDSIWACLKGTETVVATCFAEDESGRLWIGSFDKGLFCLDQGKLYQYGTKQGLGDNNVLTLCSRNDELWISTFSGINHLLGPVHAPEISSPIQGFSGHFAYSLLFDSQGVLWIGTDGAGLYSWKEGKLKVYDNPFKGSQVYDLAEDNKQQIWVATSDLGFWTIKNNGIPQLKIPVTDRALHIHHLDQGNMLAFSGDKMILYYSAVDHYFVLGKNSGTFPGSPDIKALFNKKHEVCMGVGGVPYLLKLPDDPDWLKPRLLFYGTNINGIPYQQFPAKLGSDENILRIQFQAFWYRNPANLVYRYRLTGIDTNWQFTKDDALYFGKLPSGRYLLDFEVDVNESFFLPARNQLAFERTAPLYAQPWFIASAALVFLGLMLMFLHLRIRRITRLEKLERDKLTFQLETLRNQVNPHFIFNSFNTLQGLIDTNPGNATAYLEKLARFFRNLLLLRNKNSITLKEELELLENYEALQRERFGKKFVVHRDILPEALDHYIAPMTLQILLENALKHNALSKKDPLIIHIKTPDNLQVHVSNPIRLKTDSGNTSTATGLKNIQERSLLRTGKKVDIVNGPGEFIVKVPLSKDP